ncbi:MAG: hypothetical protein AB7E36_03505 [Salinivirgaceae bacterium]
MIRIFTFYYSLKKMWGRKANGEVSMFIHKGLNHKFEPNDQTIKNILAFSDAYQQKQSKSIGTVEYLIN